MLIYLSYLCYYISRLIYYETYFLLNDCGGTMRVSQAVFPVSISLGTCCAVVLFIYRMSCSLELAGWRISTYCVQKEHLLICTLDIHFHIY